MSRATAATEELGGPSDRAIDLSRTVGWFTAKYPVAPGDPAHCAGPRWSPVTRRSARVIKDAKEQLRALPDGLTYGLLRYLRRDVDLSGPDPAIAFNYLGRLGGTAGDAVRRSVADPS